MTVPATTQTTHEIHHEVPQAARHEVRPSFPRPGRTAGAPAPHTVPASLRPAPWAAQQRTPEPVGRPEPALDPALFAILRCPLTGGALVPVDADRLMSDRPFRDGVHPVYPVVNGIACLSPVR